MAEALIAGLCRADFDATTIFVSEPDATRRDTLKARYGINTSADNHTLVENCETCVLAVKPQVMRSVLQPLAEVLEKYRPLLVSVAAGVTVASLESLSGGHCAIVRAMPNTPALVGRGATAIFAGENVSSTQHERAEFILQTTGITRWLDSESLLDVVTALSGSGPAYFFLMMESLIEAACKHGLDTKIARDLCIQTALGAAELAGKSDVSLSELRRRVTSPAGTTERGVEALQRGGIVAAATDAIDAARLRSIELSKDSGDDS
ncbi:MAG: pyrroline-5-carboxylate reductase [marine bacterium B5-7]|nr:MAG: pyrroline-5-carboxylate reductase [marine bacterium B5-7]